MAASCRIPICPVSEPTLAATLFGPMSIQVPADPAELRDAIAWAVAERQPLELLGRGSKRALGRPVQVEHVLDLSRLAGIVDYEPTELVLTARAATPLAEIEALLLDRNQMLAFEPPDWGALLGATEVRQTLGGVLACNLAGPRRIRAGAARDHFLGFEAVSGRGEIFKAGGRVVKNVTGYDLCKLMAGSYGTLAAITEVSVKVLPRPEKSRTVLILGLDDRAAVAALAKALNSPHEVSAAAHLPQPVALRSQVSYVGGAGRSVTAVRVEGPGPSVAYRCEQLRQMLGDLGPVEELHSHNSIGFWREVGAVAPLTNPAGRLVWRVSVAPSAGPTVTAALSHMADAAWFYDWGGGLVWLALAPTEDGGAPAIHEIVRRTGGHATLVRAPAVLRAAVDVFSPLEPGRARLMAEVKEGFDPRRILNPGRMAASL
jgi:glycolate oxidase FAD binding subunit